MDTWGRLDMDFQKRLHRVKNETGDAMKRIMTEEGTLTTELGEECTKVHH